MESYVNPESSEPLSGRPVASVAAVVASTVGSIDEEFERFYRREHDGQVRRAYLMLGSSAAAHDVVADAFLAVLRRWDSIEQPGPYLNRCVLNGCRDLHRLAPRERVAADPLEGDLAGVGGSGFAGTAVVGTSDVADHMAEQLLLLPFRQRAAIVLRYYGGYRETDIADYLGCRPGTVGSLTHRGLRTLRKAMSSKAVNSRKTEKTSTEKVDQ